MADIIMKPTIGRIVHFVAQDGEEPIHVAAIITEVPVGSDVGRVSLQPIPPGRLAGRHAHEETNVEHDETARKLFTWHWPERE